MSSIKDIKIKSDSAMYGDITIEKLNSNHYTIKQGDNTIELNEKNAKQVWDALYYIMGIHYKMIDTKR